MAAMNVVALGSGAAVAPASGLLQKRSNKAAGGQVSAFAAKVPGGGALGNAAGVGRIPLRLYSKNKTPGVKRSLVVTATRSDSGQVDQELKSKADEFLKTAKETWGKIDDKLAVGGLGFAALIVLWGSFGLIYAIDKLPLIPQLLEIVGLVFTGWFVYRYLLFEPDRQELLKLVDEAKSKITGQADL